MMAAFNVTKLQNFGYNEVTDFGDPEDARWSARPYVHTDFENGSGPFSQQAVTKRVQEIAREQPYSELAEVEAALDEAWADGTAQKRSRAVPRYRRFIV
jgi:bilirubin oxidase